MGRLKTRPFDPASAERQRLARLDKAAEAQALARTEDARPQTWGVNAEPLALPANQDVSTVTDARGRVAHAHRADVFEILHGRGGLSEAELRAARRLEQDIGLRAGLFRPETSYVLVDAQGCSEGLTQRMVEAGRRVDEALSAIGPRQALLLRGLIEPLMLQGRAVAWREVVQRETRETNPHVQAAMVRAACDNLALAYQAVDARPRPRDGRARP